VIKDIEMAQAFPVKHSRRLRISARRVYNYADDFEMIFLSFALSAIKDILHG